MVVMQCLFPTKDTLYVKSINESFSCWQFPILFFQGRTNKLVDGCYSFWQGGLLPLLHNTLSNEEKKIEKIISSKVCTRILSYFIYLEPV